MQVEAETLDGALEAALQLHVSRRCERAYAHDLRNSLQPLQSGIEVLLKLAGGKSSTVTPEKVSTIVRKAMAAHEQSLERTVKHLTLRDAAAVVDLAPAIRETVHFLNNDAAARGVALRVGNSATLLARVGAGRLRLVLLGATLRLIDLLPRESELTATALSEGDVVAIELASKGTGLPDQSFWQDDWVLTALREVAASEGGQIESRDGQRPGSIVRIKFPAARSGE